MITITKEFLFDAAHKLERQDLSPEENQKIYGKCYRLHGHTFKMHITVSGQVDENGMIINFADLKTLVQSQIISRYDHNYLNDLPEFKNRPATVENLIQSVYERLSPVLNDQKLKLQRITVYETPTSFATIEPHA